MSCCCTDPGCCHLAKLLLLHYNQSVCHFPMSTFFWGPPLQWLSARGCAGCKWGTFLVHVVSAKFRRGAGVNEYLGGWADGPFSYAWKFHNLVEWLENRGVRTSCDGGSTTWKVLLFSSLSLCSTLLLQSWNPSDIYNDEFRGSRWCLALRHGGATDWEKVEQLKSEETSVQPVTLQPVPEEFWNILSDSCPPPAKTVKQNSLSYLLSKFRPFPSDVFDILTGNRTSLFKF